MLGKAVTLVLLTGAWLFIGALGLFFTMPLWGMSRPGQLPTSAMFVGAGLIVWVAAYLVAVVAIIRYRDPR